MYYRSFISGPFPTMNSANHRNIPSEKFIDIATISFPRVKHSQLSTFERGVMKLDLWNVLLPMRDKNTS